LPRGFFFFYINLASMDGWDYNKVLH